MGNYLGIRFAFKLATARAQLFAQAFEVLDNAIVDQRQFVRSVRMRVAGGRRAVRRPAGVGDADITGSVVGFEALLRWTSPQFGIVSPAKFVPLAEEARLIVPIGEWVLRTACQEAMNWPSAVKVAVNVSADQLTEVNFLSTIVSALEDSGLPPHRLEIEVTESIFMREGTGAAEMLDQIIALGINLSLDDFGTGYSSLGYLRKTRFTTIKVDRSFVQGAAKKAPESLAIIRAVVAMADALGMSTTAEGAETEVQMIKQLGCTKIQGYYFGRPMVAEDARILFDTFDGEQLEYSRKSA